MDNRSTSLGVIDNMRKAIDQKNTAVRAIAAYDEVAVFEKKSELLGDIEALVASIQEMSKDVHIGTPIGNSGLSALMLVGPGNFSTEISNNDYDIRHVWHLEAEILVGGIGGVGLLKTVLRASSLQEVSAEDAWGIVLDDFNVGGRRYFPEYRKMGKFKSFFLKQRVRTLAEDGVGIAELERIKAHLEDAIERETARISQEAERARMVAAQKGPGTDLIVSGIQVI